LSTNLGDASAPADTASAPDKSDNAVPDFLSPTESYKVYGSVAKNGFFLIDKLIGTGYSPQARILLDFDSAMYMSSKITACYPAPPAPKLVTCAKPK
jgi:hypothetical protein